MRIFTPLLTLLSAFCIAGGAMAQPAPVIERLQPTSGPPGIEMQVVGRGLSRDAVIRLGGTELEVVRRGPTRWTLRIPAGATSGNVSIEAGGVRFDGPYFRVTEAPPAPVITGVQPGQAPPGSEVTLSGSNFSARPLGNTVTLAGRSVVIRSATPTRLVVIVPDGAESGAFEVRVSNAGSATSEPFSVTAGIRITSVEPPMGPPGGEVVIHGTGFSSRVRDNRVFVGNSPLRVLRATDTALTVRLPRRFSDGPILVDVRGASRAESPQPFRRQERPEVAEFEPASAPPGARVTINGANFGVDPRAVSVRVGEVRAEIRGIADDALVFEVPEGGATARVTVRVHGLEVTSRREFGILVPVGVADFSPRSGPVGTIVTLTGQGFSPESDQNHVTISGREATIVSNTGSEIQFEVPETSSGRVEVAVTNNGEAETDEVFVITTPPFVAGFEPAVGTPGTEVLIRGSQFGDDIRLVRVAVGETAMQVTTVRPDQIVAVVPRRAATGRIRVTVQMQGSANSGSDFRVIPTAAVEGVEPAEGYPGREIALQGYGFPASGVQVRFPGAGLVEPTSISSRVIRVEVPAAAIAGPLALVLSDGRSLAAPTELQIVATPEGVGVEAVRPACTHVGCQVVIRGYGFEPRTRRNRVFFGARRVRVDRATPTSLVLTLPNSPGTERIRIEVRDRGETSTDPITVTARFQMDVDG